MPRRITPEFLAGYFDASATISLANESEALPRIVITLAAKRKRVLEAVANKMAIGKFSQLPVANSYYYYWRITDYDEIEVLIDKIREHVVVYHELVEAIITYYSCQLRLNALVASGEEFVSNRKTKMVQQRQTAVTDMIRLIKEFA
jgi:hypothetical protein